MSSRSPSVDAPGSDDETPDGPSIETSDAAIDTHDDAPAERTDTGMGDDEATGSSSDSRTGDSGDSATGDSGDSATGSDGTTGDDGDAPALEDDPGDGATRDGYGRTQEDYLRPLSHTYESGPVGADVSFRLPLLLLFVPIALVTLLSLLWPGIFFDQFVDKYYWTPIKEDLGFNPVNTATWALLLIVLLLLLDRTVRRVEQPMTFSVILAVLPYIVGGSIVRVFEDTRLLSEPLRYFFITPNIYVLITAVAVLWLVIGHILKRQSEVVGVDNALIALGLFLGALVLGYLVWGHLSDDLATFTTFDNEFVYISTLILALCFAVPYWGFHRYTRDQGRFDQVGVMAVFGIGFLLFAIYHLMVWLSGQQWGPKAGAEPVHWVFAAMFLAPGAITAIVVFVAAQMRTRFPAAVVYLIPINVLLVFSQVMDGVMTAIGIDLFSYREKHVIPDLLIQMAAGSGVDVIADNPTFAVFLPLKVVVSLLVVWAIDVWAREDMERYPNLVMLAKMAIIIVGLAPGVRNSVRLAMQV